MSQLLELVQVPSSRKPIGTIESEGLAVELRFQRTSILVKSEALEETFLRHEAIERKNKTRSHPRIQYGRLAYSSYPFYFLPAFGKDQVAPETVRRIALAGRLYLAHLKASDAQLDTDRVSALAIAESQTYARLSLMILHDLFPADSKFWPFFEHQNTEYYRALATERYRSPNGGIAISDDDFYLNSTRKSCVAKCSAHALAAAIGYERFHDLLESLDHSQDHFHAAYQMADDLVDCSDDLVSGNQTWLLGRLNQYCRSVDVEMSNESLPQLLSESGLTKKALEYCHEHLAEAKLAMNGFDVPGWVQLIDSMMPSSDVDENSRDSPNSPVERSTLAGTTPNRVQDAVDLGINFLRMTQTEIGAWIDFNTRARQSTNWVTGYVAGSIRYIPEASELVRQAKEFLSETQEESGGWGYSESMCVDVDSTSWSLISIDKQELNSHRGIEFLLAQQQDDGGFGTYGDSKCISAAMKTKGEASFLGWQGPHNCVSAVALQALIKHLGTKDLHVRKCVRYLLTTQNPSGNWSSYWWDSNLYATCHAIVALSLIDTTEANASIECGRKWVVAQQCPDGSWCGQMHRGGSAFATALALQALTTHSKGTDYMVPISRGAHWLLENQAVDGSWGVSPILRLPWPNDTNPSESSPWFVKTNSGLGQIIRDESRIFTSATAVSALWLLRELNLPEGAIDRSTRVGDLSEGDKQALSLLLSITSTQLGMRTPLDISYSAHHDSSIRMSEFSWHLEVPRLRNSNEEWVFEVAKALVAMATGASLYRRELHEALLVEGMAVVIARLAQPEFKVEALLGLTMNELEWCDQHIWELVEWREWMNQQPPETWGDVFLDSSERISLDKVPFARYLGWLEANLIMHEHQGSDNELDWHMAIQQSADISPEKLCYSRVHTERIGR